MGLVSGLHYEVPRANVLQRALQKVAASRPGSWVFQCTLHRADSALYRLTRGRVTVPGLMAGLPVILLTSTGAKTGKERAMPLLGIPVGDDMAVIGSNFGREPTPAWVYNLRANPEATIAFGPKSAEVTARPATEAETERAFESASVCYGGYGSYRQRASHRRWRCSSSNPDRYRARG